jgi:hypothetical protein
LIARTFIDNRGRITAGEISSEIKVNNLAKYFFVALALGVVILHLIAYA